MCGASAVLKPGLGGDGPWGGLPAGEVGALLRVKSCVYFMLLVYGGLFVYFCFVCLLLWWVGFDYEEVVVIVMRNLLWL